MARIIELLFVAFLLFLAYRRIAAPIQRGFDERERERKASKQQNNSPQTKLDRSSARDAAFKDLP